MLPLNLYYNVQNYTMSNILVTISLKIVRFDEMLLLFPKCKKKLLSMCCTIYIYIGTFQKLYVCCGEFELFLK